jgi:hypothetical protein
MITIHPGLTNRRCEVEIEDWFAEKVLAGGQS